MARPAVRYATTADGLEIAYQVLGDGPLDFVIVPGLTSRGRHTISVNGPWRITFEWDGENAVKVDLEQYH